MILCSGNYTVDLPSGLQISPDDRGHGDWLAHIAVTVDPTLVLDDRNQPLTIPEVRSPP